MISSTPFPIVRSQVDKLHVPKPTVNNVSMEIYSSGEGRRGEGGGVFEDA